MRKIAIIGFIILISVTVILFLIKGEEKIESLDTQEKSELDIVSNDNYISNPTFVVDVISTDISKEEVVVNICVEGNTGVSSIGMTVTYDSVLTLKEIVYNDNINGETVKPEFYNSPIKLIWVNAFEEISEDFVFATLYFGIDKNTSGDFPINLYYNDDDVYDFTQNNIKFNVVNGAVQIN